MEKNTHTVIVCINEEIQAVFGHTNKEDALKTQRICEKILKGIEDIIIDGYNIELVDVKDI